MLRRIMIILAAAVAALALATAPAGAGAGSLHLYSAPNFGGTHATVPSTTVDDYFDTCVPVDTLTSQVLSSAQSTQNYTSYDIKLYGATGCTTASFIVRVNANTTWTAASATETAVAVFVIQP